jgi:hypothetical protein
MHAGAKNFLCFANVRIGELSEGEAGLHALA